MGKNKDIIKILLLVIIGMLIPFGVAITLSYGFNTLKIAITFGYFLLIFGFELLFVYLYFTIGNWYAQKNMEKYKPK